jgi:two-component system NtrC family sensor kinase
MAPARSAIVTGTLVSFIGVLLIVSTTWIATSHLVGRIGRAVSERDAISRDLMRSAKLASLGELATGLAHEINNPLAVMSAEHTNISDALEALDGAGGSRDETRRIEDSVSRCRRQVERCRAVTVKMLQFGRHTEQRLTLTDIAPLLDESAALMRKQVAEEEVTIAVDAAPDLPRLLVDGNELEQVLVNLVTNAIQAVGRKGRILVKALRVEDEVEISVGDTGCGIPEASLDHVFQPFYTTKPVGVGTGLGLSVCHGIIRGLSGSIDVSSTVGKGTTVVIRLPVPGRGTPEEAER